MKFCKLTETSPGVFALPVARIFSQGGWMKEYVGSQRVVAMPADWQNANGYRAFFDAPPNDPNWSAGGSLDTDSGSAVDRSYPSPLLKDDAILLAAQLEKLAAHRWAVEVAGVMFNGLLVPSGRGDRTALKHAIDGFDMVASGTPPTVPFKVSNGAFARIDKPTLEGAWTMVLMYVQNCYTVEEMHTTALQALTGEAIITYDIYNSWPELVGAA